MRFDVTALSPEELVVLIADAKRELYPEAVILCDELECSACHERGTPALIEDGMTVTSGLAAGEVVVTAGVHKLRADQEVRLAAAPPAGAAAQAARRE